MSFTNQDISNAASEPVKYPVNILSSPADEDSEVQKGLVTCPREYSQKKTISLCLLNIYNVAGIFESFFFPGWARELCWNLWNCYGSFSFTDGEPQSSTMTYPCVTELGHKPVSVHLANTVLPSGSQGFSQPPEGSREIQYMNDGDLA